MSALPSEDDMIATYFAPLAGPGALGLKDDAAVIAPPPNHEIVVTKDALVAGVHFFADDPPSAIAQKALRVNLSDLAAKGAEPMGFLLALAISPDVTREWLEGFAAGLGDDVAAYRFPLLGGDTVKTPGPLTLSVTAFGLVPQGHMVPRTGAEEGDVILVSGFIGDAALGLRIRLARDDDKNWIAGLSTDARAYLLDRYLVPQPRVGLRKILRACGNAGIDVSDGLAGDLTKLAKVSEVGAHVDLKRVPLSLAAQEAIALRPDLFDLCMTGGDDYEVLCTVPGTHVHPFEAGAKIAGVSVTRIGEIRAGADVNFVRADGTLAHFARGSFSHF